MLSYVQFVPLVVFIPAIGAIINLFWGAKLGVKGAGYVASGAALLTFILSVLIFNYLSATHGIPQVVDPFRFLNGWIRIGANDVPVNIPWQFRVDTLTSVMLLVVTGVGSLIHIYSIGYISHDPKYSRFFSYLNMFLGFMLILVTANNFLMMFVGWEGVGVMSFLLIGFWWDKKGVTGWNNGNAARKAMILNRVGDFGILMAIFLMFWTFGTVTYYEAGEIANPCFQLEGAGYHLPAECEAEHGEEAATEETEATTEEHSEAGTAAETEEEHAEGEEAHGLVLTEEQLNNSLFTPSQLGVFGQAARLLELEEGEEIVWDAEGNTRGREVQLGTWTTDIKTVVTLIVLFLLLGAAGKSAQFPLLVWLPDAMAGPTPVSALMHAATMVTAGVYLLARSHILLEGAPEARFVVAMAGAITALFGGIAAVGQWDIKRVLAYSTISQLGFMVAAIGVGGYVAGIFHLATHAVFKALLFLGSGSVIHGVEHGEHHVHEHSHGHGHDDHHDEHDEHQEGEHAFDPQDMRNMGGLARRMPVTYITYLIGTFGLMGLPFFAGFWSKDEILAEALHKAFLPAAEGGTPLENLGGLIVFGTLVIAAFFTTFYMWRQIQMVFFGEPRSEAAAHAPESVPWMTIPLVILMLLTIVVGFINVPEGAIPFSWIFKHHEFAHYLESTIAQEGALSFNWLLAIGTSVLLPGLAIFLAHGYYAGDKAVRQNESDALGVDPLWLNPAARQLWVAANHRLYLDDLYRAVFLYPYQRIGKFLAEVLDWRMFHDYFHNNVVHKGFNAVGDVLRNPVDIGLIDGIVNGVGKAIALLSGRSRGIQTGYVRTYAIALLFGVVLVIFLMIAPLLMNGSGS